MPRILVVDDHPTMREAVRLVLETGGHEVECVGDGDSALAVARTTQPDLIVLDLNIPGLTGPELMDALRAEEVTRAIPLVVVTATGEEGRRSALGAGAAAYMTKPFSPAALLRTIERVSGAPGSPAG